MLYTQPQGPSLIDRAGNGSRLQLAVIPAIARRNLANNVVGTIAGTTPNGNFVTSDQYGLDLMVHPSGGTNGFGGIRFTADTASGGNDWTFIWVGRPQNYSSANGSLMIRGADGAGNGWNVHLTYEVGPISGSGSGNLVARVVDSSPAAFAATISSLPMVVGQHERVALVKRGTTIKVFNWRTRQVASASAGNGALRTSTVGVGLGFATTSATTTSGHNKVNTALAYNIGMPDSEVWALLNNPWKDFEQDDMLWRAASGASYSLTAAAGSYALTSNAAGLSVARRLTASPGAYAITDNSAGLRAARRMTAAAGTYALTGNAATLTYTPLSANYVLTASTGTYNLTGSNAALRVARRLTADAGSYAVTGNAASLLRGYTIQTATGSYAMAGETVAMRLDRVLLADAGSFAITGNDATLSGPMYAERYARPMTAIASGCWLPSTPAAPLYSMIDEATQSATDYIYANGACTCEVKLNPVVDPLTSNGQVVRYQAWSPEGNGVTVSLMQGETVIASWEHAVLPLTATIYVQALSAEQCDSITNYADLRFRFSAA